jgi:hypothetical protein
MTRISQPENTKVSSKPTPRRGKFRQNLHLSFVKTYTETKKVSSKPTPRRGKESSKPTPNGTSQPINTRFYISSKLFKGVRSKKHPLRRKIVFLNPAAQCLGVCFDESYLYVQQYPRTKYTHRPPPNPTTAGFARKSRPLSASQVAAAKSNETSKSKAIEPYDPAPRRRGGTLPAKAF